MQTYFFKIDVIGKSNKELWGDKLKNEVDGPYDIVVDLNTRDEVFKQDLVGEARSGSVGCRKNKWNNNKI